jgi:hypothetical protein
MGRVVIAVTSPWPGTVSPPYDPLTVETVPTRRAILGRPRRLIDHRRPRGYLIETQTDKLRCGVRSLHRVMGQPSEVACTAPARPPNPTRKAGPCFGLPDLGVGERQIMSRPQALAKADELPVDPGSTQMPLCAIFLA